MHLKNDGASSTGLNAGLVIDTEPGRYGKLRFKVRYNGVLLHSDTLNPHDAAARAKLSKKVVAKIREKFGDNELSVEEVERALLALVDRQEAGEAADREAAEPGEYRACLHDDPEVHGIYRLGPNGPMKLANFTLAIERDVLVRDDQQDERRFEGDVRLDGASHPFAIDADEFGDVGKLKAAVYSTAGPRARFIGKPETVRDAISALSNPESVVRTTSAGWNSDATAFLTPTGVVDRDGFRPYGRGEPRVDVGTDGPTRGLGLTGLSPREVAALKRHLVEDFLRLHERPVMFTLAGAVALAVLLRHASVTQRPAFWLRGLTGAGKSFPAKLAANFFGDFPLDDDGRFAAWVSTANYIERTGYSFRDALYMVDDYKPELITGAQAVRVLQAYADGAGRGRLQSDARAHVTRPIRGLLLSTGEDLPQNNASALARMVIIDVPNCPKQLDLAARCMAMRPSYRGLTADFVRWLIAGGRTAGFVGHVERHRGRFYQDIVGRPNDARIAGNFALLAAAFEEFAVYLGDAWPGAEAEVRGYLEEDLVAARDRILGIAREQQASEIFLDTLRALLAHNKVRFQEEKGVGFLAGEVIGKAAGEFYEVSIPMAWRSSRSNSGGRDGTCSRSPTPP